MVLLRVDTQLSSSVYFPGDEIICALQLSNNIDPNKSVIPTKVLWVSVQFYGYIQVHKYWKLSSPGLFSDVDVLGNFVLKQPVLVEKAKKQKIHFFATDEQVIDCDFQITDYKTYIYKVKLPQTLEGGVSPLPPTYPTFLPNEIVSLSGNENKTNYNSRIRYILSISIKSSLNQPLQIIQLPIHVLSPLCGQNKINFAYHSFKQIQKTSKTKEVRQIISNKYLLNELKSNKTVEDEEENEMELVYRPSTYRISKDDEVFVHFSISSSVFTAGDTISCTLTFLPKSSVVCYQSSVTLESREQMNIDLLSADINKPTRSSIRKLIYGEHIENSVSSLQSSFSFYIPTDSIHEFQSDIVSVKWYLNFEFIVGKRNDPSNTKRFEVKKKEVVPVEQFLWELPIKVGIFTPPRELRCPSTLIFAVQ